MKSKLKKIKYIKGMVTVFIVTILFISAHFCSKNWYQLMIVQGRSMEPTIHNFQLVVIDKTENFYEQGDIIAFKKTGINGVLVKRIIGIPGDEITIKNGCIFINEEICNYISETIEDNNYGVYKDGCKITVPTNAYFVLGDNVNESIDSRNNEIGYIKINQIEGKIRFFSF